MITEEEAAYIDPAEADELHESDDGAEVGDWKRLGVQHIRTSRWSEVYWLVVERVGDGGRVWGLEYREGLTEEQENEYPWRPYAGTPGPLPLVRLYPRAVVAIQYYAAPVLSARCICGTMPAADGYVYGCPTHDAGGSR